MLRLRAPSTFLPARLFGLALLLAAGLAAADAVQPSAGGVPQPVIEPARGGTCVEDPAFMRRNHMELLKHQRDDTLRGGVRRARHSLKGCIECHASRGSGSVAATQGDFCRACHSYAAVQIDCFECHASRPGQSAALAGTGGAVGAKSAAGAEQASAPPKQPGPR